MLHSRHQNAGRDQDVKTATRCFGNVARFIYLGMTVTNQNLIHEEVQRRMNSSPSQVGSCYNRMALPRAADGATASSYGG
jgi:hypothetical protein